MDELICMARDWVSSMELVLSLSLCLSLLSLSLSLSLSSFSLLSLPSGEALACGKGWPPPSALGPRSFGLGGLPTPCFLDFVSMLHARDGAWLHSWPFVER